MTYKTYLQKVFNQQLDCQLAVLKISASASIFRFPQHRPARGGRCWAGVAYGQQYTWASPLTARYTAILAGSGHSSTGQQDSLKRATAGVEFKL